MQDKVCRKCGDLWSVHYKRNLGDDGCSAYKPSPDKLSDGVIYRPCQCTGFEERADIYRVYLDIDFKAEWPDKPAIHARITDDSVNPPMIVTFPRFSGDMKADEHSWQHLMKRIAERTGILPEMRA